MNLSGRQSLERWLPVLGAVRRYHRAELSGDLAAGITTAVMLIPQGMGYAMLAGLPPIIGLYSSLVPLLVYAVFGTSRQLAVGPVAMVSLLVATGVGAVAQPGTPEYVAYAVLLALLVGGLQLSMGVLRLGFVVNFLSHPVISGFTSAAALIIGLSQLRHLLGVNLPRTHYVHEVALEATRRIAEVNVPTLALGSLAIALLMALRRWAPRLPGALIVVVLGSLATRLFGLERAGVAIVGTVPGGLPSASLPELRMDVVGSLFSTALAIALVGFMESIAVAKRYAREGKYSVFANQELVALGLSNLFGSLFQASPVTGGFSRTAVNAQAGARTTLAGALTAVVVGLTLLFLTPLFHHLPNAILAAIIMTAVFGLVDVAEARHLWQVKRSDAAMLATTFVATLALGVETGIAVGVLASLGLVLYRTTRPHVAVLGRLPGTEVYRNVLRFPEAETVAGVLVVRLDAQFYFGNVNFLQEKLAELERGLSSPMRALVLDASGINQLDASAESALRDTCDAYRERGVTVVLAGVKGPVRDVLARSGLAGHLGEGAFALRVHDAVQRLERELRGAPKAA